MNAESSANWYPFRPGVKELEKIRGEVAEVRSIQQRILAKSEQIRSPDRVAHQYQIAGSKVLLRIAETVQLAQKRKSPGDWLVYARNGQAQSARRESSTWCVVYDGGRPGRSLRSLLGLR